MSKRMRFRAEMTGEKQSCYKGHCEGFTVWSWPSSASRIFEIGQAMTAQSTMSTRTNQAE